MQGAVKKMTDEHGRAVREHEEAEITTQSDPDQVEAMHRAIKRLTRMIAQVEERHSRLTAIVTGT